MRQFMKQSRFEKFNHNAILALSEAIKEENYKRDSEYIIAIRNVTNCYNVDFTHTDDGEWADEVFEQACEIMTNCALMHKETMYIVIFAKSRKDCTIEFIKENHMCIKTK